MFTVDTGNYLIKVKFMHFWTIEHNFKNRRFITNCNIKIFRKENEEEIYNEQIDSICNPVDYTNGFPNRNLGKKFALSMLLEPYWKKVNNNLTYPDGKMYFYPILHQRLTKDVRRAIWNKFIETFPPKKSKEYITGYKNGYSIGWKDGSEGDIFSLEVK